MAVKVGDYAAVDYLLKSMLSWCIKVCDREGISYLTYSSVAMAIRESYEISGVSLIDASDDPLASVISEQFSDEERKVDTEGWKAFFEEPIMLIPLVLQRAKIKGTSDMTRLLKPSKGRLLVQSDTEGPGSAVEVPSINLSVGDQIIVLPGVHNMRDLINKEFATAVKVGDYAAVDYLLKSMLSWCIKICDREGIGYLTYSSVAMVIRSDGSLYNDDRVCLMDRFNDLQIGVTSQVMVIPITELCPNPKIPQLRDGYSLNLEPFPIFFLTSDGSLTKGRGTIGYHIFPEKGFVPKSLSCKEDIAVFVFGFGVLLEPTEDIELVEIIALYSGLIRLKELKEEWDIVNVNIKLDNLVAVLRFWKLIVR